MQSSLFLLSISMARTVWGISIFCLSWLCSHNMAIPNLEWRVIIVAVQAILIHEKHWNAACVWLKISGKGWKRNQGLRLQERLSLIPRKPFGHASEPRHCSLGISFFRRVTTLLVKFCECSGCSLAFPSHHAPGQSTTWQQSAPCPPGGLWVATWHMSRDMSWDMLFLRQNERHVWTWDKLIQV